MHIRKAKKLTTRNFTSAVQDITARVKLAKKDINVSDLQDEFGNQYIDLVQEGGGVLGIEWYASLYPHASHR